MVLILQGKIDLFNVYEVSRKTISSQYFCLFGGNTTEKLLIAVLKLLVTLKQV